MRKDDIQKLNTFVDKKVKELSDIRNNIKTGEKTEEAIAKIIEIEKELDAAMLEADDIGNDLPYDILNKINATIREAEILHQQLPIIKKSNVSVAKYELKLLEKYFDKHPEIVYRFKLEDELSDDEILELQYRMKSIYGDKYRTMIKEAQSQITVNRVSNGNDDNTTNGNDTVNDEKEKNKVDDYLKKLDYLEKVARNFYNKLLLDNKLIENFTNTIKEIKDLCDQYATLKKEGEDILNEIKTTKELDASVITDRWDELRTTLIRIKNTQIAVYNSYVKYVNEKIAEIKKNGVKLPDEVINLKNMDEINITVTSYNRSDYFKLMQYEEIAKRIAIIEKNYAYTNTGMTPSDPSPAPTGTDTPATSDDIKKDYDLLCKNLDEIEDLIADLNTKIAGGVDKLSADEINACNAELDTAVAFINAVDKLYIEKSNDIKNLFGLDAEQEILVRIENAIYDTYNLSSQLNKDKTKNNVFADLLEKMQVLNNSIKIFGDIILDPTLDTKQSPSFINANKLRIENYKEELDSLFNNIKKAHDDGKITDEEFKQLDTAKQKMENYLNDLNIKIKSYEEFNDLGMFDTTGKDIDDINKNIGVLETVINSCKKPINKATRKVIDAEFDKIYNDIDLIEKYIEHHKKDDPDKYNKDVDKLNNCRERLNKLDEIYRSKCPLLVRASRSAKKFYKKHKKGCLIAAGLAAIALVHATIGPVIIPGIMYGNQMLAIKAGGFLNPLLTSINNILGGAINAKLVPAVVNGAATTTWQLANGALLSLNCANASILGGLSLIAAPIAAVAHVVKKLAKMKSGKKNKKKIGEPTAIPSEEITVVEPESEPEEEHEREDTSVTYDVFIKLLIDKNPNVDMYADDKSNLYVYNPEDLSLPDGYELNSKDDNKVTVTNGTVSFDIYNAVNYDMLIEKGKLTQIHEGKNSTERRGR